MKILLAALALSCAATAAAQMPLPRHQAEERVSATVQRVAAGTPDVVAVNAVTAVIPLRRALVMVDPVGDQATLRRFGRPDIVVLTSTRTSHLSIDTMIGLLRRDTVVLAPQDVIDRLPLMISNNVITPFNPGTTQTVRGIIFTAKEPGAAGGKGVQVHDRKQGDIAVTMETEGGTLLF